MSDVYVTLTEVSGQGAWGSNGKTNTSGTAIITTNWGRYFETGVPSGKYIVSIEEIIRLPNGKTYEDFEKMTVEESIQYSDYEAKEMNNLRIIPKQLSDSNKSPLTIVVTEQSRNEFRIEIQDYVTSGK
jgi:hypothetical protein